MNKLTNIFTMAALAAGAGYAQYTVVDLNAPSTLVASANAANGGVQGGYASAGAVFHAYVWSGTSASGTDVHPLGWYSSQIWGAAAGQQVGYGFPTPATDVTAGAHAVLWSGGGFLDLHPAGWGYSLALCTTGYVEGGYGLAPKASKGGGKQVQVQHAIQWMGSAASAVDMNPAGMLDSRIYGCSDTRQVGDASPKQIGATHAMLWTGTAASAVDLHPKNYLVSTASGVAGDQQVGSGMSLTSPRHALLWRGTADSVVDLHPAAYQVSNAYATNGTQQVGDALDANSRWHAVAWSGTADTAIDLNAFLPAGYTEARARAIDAGGNIVGYASTPTGSHAVIWLKQ